ncbi:MAG: apolipoprotein N-acyltransferase [Bosea sp.]|uniref:apolipoprotein N-acyltransferase n=1 Tax=unclassified Bosea (in: a-proteobacteria) TaxID=2653178 RepID=UPI00095D2211|nr:MULTISPECIES: apolipoprotein N-acyltransferase [unclassified Bosea (in: a-proteobacteria)]MBN9441734.1 apolipoprotein N-acyltransferase [Bosea sp. (in: a-proteobacteria)]MBN9457556.1 apolipoprotein N-acyltransferase [Bosea sp. (in: a-proteobacteria)]OJV10154.1 MAG: apolipoprotein N-acyltransferase [Bosea sp. 67-29]
MRIARVAEAVILAWGWRRRLIAFAAGASGALALPPLDLWPLVVVPMTLAVWLMDGAVGTTRRQRFRSAFAAGWWWGFGFFVAGLWWLGAAFLVEADKFAWALPLGVVALPAFLAVFPAFAFGAARLFWPKGAGRILVLAALLGTSEWLRGHVLTGFPWNVYGMMLTGEVHLEQVASLFGLYGLTLFAVAIGAAPATLGTGMGRSGRWAPTCLAVASLAAFFAYGFWRVPSAPSPLVAGVKLRLMQPNLPQDAKFNGNNGAAILEHYLELSDRATSPQTPGLQAVTHLIWPESAFPFLLGRTPQALSRIAAALPPDVTLITGAARAGEILPGEGRPPIYNSIQVVNDEGVIVASYDKTHLVPFGEYLPPILGTLIRAVGLSQFVSIPGGFSSGNAHLPLAIKGLPNAAPLICYEAVFPGAVVPRGARPAFFLNVTNDGWFGQTSGPYQHFAQARLRSVEEGLPLVRVANTGISGVVDAYGRVVASLPLGSEGVLDVGLPRPGPLTVYARLGDLVFAGMLVLFLLLAWIRRG